MNHDEVCEILEKNGWMIECESPFEARHEETNSYASGLAIYLIAEYYKNNV